MNIEWRWEDMCGPDGLHPWNPKTRDMGYCFQRLFILIPSLFLLAVVSSFYAGRHIDWVVRGRLQERTVLLRSIIVLCMIIIPLVKIYKGCKFTIDYFECCTEIVAWFTHFCYVMALKHRLGKSPRGPTLILVLWSITAVMSVTSLRTLISTHQPYAFAIITLVLQIKYALTLLPSEGKTSPTYFSPCLVGSQYSQLSEQHPLLQTFIENGGPLGIAMLGSSYLSKLLFYWVNPLFSKGVKDPDDLFDLPPNLTCAEINRKIEKALIGNVDQYSSTYNDSAARRGTYGTVNNENSVDPLPNVDVIIPQRKYNVSLLKALHSCFAFEFYTIGLLKLVADVSGFAGPLLLNRLVTFIEDPTIDTRFGYAYAGALLISSLLSSFCDSHFNMCMAIVSLKLRVAIMSTVFRKTLSVTSTELNDKFTIGEMTNFISTDTERIVNSCPSFHSVWSIPFQLVVTLYLLYAQVGISFLAGVGFSIILIPINKYVANKIGKLSTDLMHHKDGRVSLMTEIFKFIRTIKLYVWEDYFVNKVEDVRSKEMKYLTGRKYLDAICVFFWATTPVIVTALTLTTYILLGNPLTAATVFTTIALLNMLIAPLNAFPWVLNGLTEAWVSIKRIQRILDLQDFESSFSYNDELKEDDIILSLDSVTFSWVKTVKQDSNQSQSIKIMKGKRSVSKYANYQRINSSTVAGMSDEPENVVESPFKLSNISIEIKRGEFIGIIGRVGCGKSSLLNGILSEMKVIDGNICTSESTGFGYVSQKPWLQRGSIKDNILFGKSFEETKYRTVVEACGLTEDLALLGSDSCVGEGGSSLSGGQVARIALARAVYQDKQVYLLDDVLSAVDLKVGLHIYKKCILGLLKYKTRIIVTHSPTYVNQANTVILMENGCITQKGPPSVILNECDMNSLLDEDDNDSSIIMSSIPLDRSNTNGYLDEKRAGSVDLWVISLYWKSVGSWLALATLLSLLLMQLSRNTTDLWLSYWVSNIAPTNNSIGDTLKNDLILYTNNIFNTTNDFNSTNIFHGDSNNTNNFHDDSQINTSIFRDIQNFTKTIIQDLTNKIKNNLQAGEVQNFKNVRSHNNSENDVVFYLSIYATFTVMNAIFTLIRAFMFAYGGIQAAKVIHNSLLGSVMKGKMKFFDITPVGRLLNRFSSDTYTVDDSLPFILNILLALVFGIVGSIIVTAYGLPWVTLILVPLLPIYHWLQNCYRITSRELKRLSSVTLSPIYSHFNDTLEGSTVIRAFGRNNHWCQNGEHFIERYSRTILSSTAAAQWLGLRLRLMGAAVLTSAAIVAVAQRNVNTVDPGMVGLAISYALSLTSLLGGVINAFTETERELIAVERVGEYIKQIEPEGNALESENIYPPYGWPSMGIVTFKDVVLKYRPQASPSLKYVSFETLPSEKIGVVGRTGAGKSSIFASLFRLCELHSGSITIDSVDISNLSLMTLRSRLAVIPQEPFIFNGSIRQNIDPFESHSDVELWSALEKCGAKYIIRQKGGLQASATDLSRGHMQLLCLTRAILQNAKILCIDEATANIDPETDRMIQETIRCSFRKSTVITIAHRISTILDSDRIIVMGDGEILEFDTPENLMQNADSHFYQLSEVH